MIVIENIDRFNKSVFSVDIYNAWWNDICYYN